MATPSIHAPQILENITTLFPGSLPKLVTVTADTPKIWVVCSLSDRILYKQDGADSAAYVALLVGTTALVAVREARPAVAKALKSTFRALRAGIVAGIAEVETLKEELRGIKEVAEELRAENDALRKMWEADQVKADQEEEVVADQEEVVVAGGGELELLRGELQALRALVQQLKAENEAGLIRLDLKLEQVRGTIP